MVDSLFEDRHGQRAFRGCAPTEVVHDHRPSLVRGALHPLPQPANRGLRSLSERSRRPPRLAFGVLLGLGHAAMTRKCILVVAVLLAAQGASFAQSTPPAPPRDASVCELTMDPPAWHARRVRLTSTATHEFENFSLADSTCDGRKRAARVWLTYGGRVSSRAVYCCPGEGDNSERPTPLVVDGLTLPITQDKTFDEFRKMLSSRPRTKARVTLVGTFFAGTKTEMSATGWGGYGHMGCCGLLVIERVERFEVAADASEQPLVR
jgi:hypothetical protein